MVTCKLLGVPTSLTSDPSIPINSDSAPNNVSSLGIATYIRVLSVLMLLKVRFTSLMMSSSMRQFIPLANSVPMLVHIFELKFFLYLSIPNLVLLVANL
jgi:hypothetical protein